LFINQAFSREEKYDNIEKIKSRFTFTTYYINQYSYLKIQSRINDNIEAVYYSPNVKGGIGAGIKFKGFSFAYTFKLPQDERYGNTKFTDLAFGFQGRKFGFSVFYLNYKSLYIKNPEEINYYYYKNYPVRPDIKFTSLGFYTNFAFMRSFSVKAAFEQTERQKKTAGSFLFTINDRFTSLLNDSSFIPYSLQNGFDKTNKIKSMYVNTFKLAPGAGYTFVLSKYFSITTMLLTGFGLQMKFYNLDGKNKVGLRLPFYINSKSAIGYNGEDVFCRLVYNLELNNITFTDSRFKIFSTFLQFAIGFRIK
jgi:hypothetical protein